MWTTNVKLLSNTTSATNIYTTGMLRLSSGANTSNPGLYYTPQPGFVGGLSDPLNYLARGPETQPETPEQWLRRRLRETCWRPA